MFWSDVSQKTISLAQLNGTGVRVLVNSGIDVPGESGNKNIVILQEHQTFISYDIQNMSGHSYMGAWPMFAC